MAQVIQWISSNLFIVVIIVGALVSVFGRKDKAKPNGGGEPFGGRGAARPGNPARRVPSGSGPNNRQSPFAGAPARSQAEAPSSASRPNVGERGSSSKERTNLEEAARGMHAEIEKRLREQRSVQRRSSGAEQAASQTRRAAEPGSNRRPAANVTSKSSAAVPLLHQPNADELRKGILWAEILGAPRARKPYSSGRR